MIPPTPFLRAILLRATLLWIGVRFAMAYFGLLHLSLAAVLLLFLAVVAGVLVDGRARGEDIFLANLGVGSGTVGLLATGWAGILEAGLTTVLGALP